MGQLLASKKCVNGQSIHLREGSFIRRSNSPLLYYELHHSIPSDGFIRYPLMQRATIRTDSSYIIRRSLEIPMISVHVHLTYGTYRLF